MSKHFLIEAPDGSEKQVVKSLDGYPGWTVVAQNVDMPEDDDDWDSTAKKWKRNPARRAKKQRAILGRDPEYLISKIEALEARIAQLEAKGNTP